MSKTIAFIAAAGFLLCIACFALAFLIAGGQIFHGEKPFAGIKPLIDRATRKEWRWDGGDTLTVNTPTVLHYQPDGLPHVTVTGPADLLADVKVGGGQIGDQKARHTNRGEKLDAVVSGVPIRKFRINGNQQLELGHIDQDMLDVRIAGNGSVSAEGKVNQLNLVIAGNGDANLGDLSAQEAKVAILGHGNATLAPHRALYLTILGRGTVRLRSHPADIQKTIFGSGEVIDDQSGATTAGRIANGRGVHAQDMAGPSASESGQASESVHTSTGNFLVTGSGERQLGHLQQDEMKLTIAGAGSASADGKVDRLTVMVAGSGHARLAGLSARQVNVTIAGSGDATIAPRDEAHITILGSGNVYLATKPRKIERNILASGRIIEAP